MALIAIYTVVHIPGDVRVPEIGRVPVPMANGALEDRVGRASVQGIRVASDADAACTAVIEIKPRVSHRRSQPACRGVARLAGGCGLEDSGGGGVGSEVIGYRSTHRCGALPLSGVATVTIGRWPGGTGVTGNACRWRRRNVHSGQGETGGAMVKDRAHPRGRRVARLAGGRITGGDVIWHRGSELCGALPGSVVASVAGCGSELVVVARVAGNARRRHWGDVHPCQGKPRRVVVERGTGPVHRRVANGAVLGEPSSNMIWDCAS